jgi:hypothetical protein
MDMPPARKPVGDSVSGAVVRIDAMPLLMLTPPADADIIASGDLIVRYGIRLLGKLHLSLVPDLLVLDYGDMLTGEDAWDFLLRRSHLHPRAEVFGYRNDGTDDMQLVRNLDLAAPLEVLVYTSADAAVPTARPIALIAPPDADLPQRLRTHLPHFTCIADWRSSKQP